jgi:hypothetical protein
VSARLAQPAVGRIDGPVAVEAMAVSKPVSHTPDAFSSVHVDRIAQDLARITPDLDRRVSLSGRERRPSNPVVSGVRTVGLPGRGWPACLRRDRNVTVRRCDSMAKRRQFLVLLAGSVLSGILGSRSGAAADAGVAHAKGAGGLLTLCMANCRSSCYR